MASAAAIELWRSKGHSWWMVTAYRENFELLLFGASSQVGLLTIVMAATSAYLTWTASVYSRGMYLTTSSTNKQDSGKLMT